MKEEPSKTPTHVEVEDLVVKLTFSTGETITHTLEGYARVHNMDEDGQYSTHDAYMRRHLGQYAPISLSRYLYPVIKKGEEFLSGFLDQDFFKYSEIRLLERRALVSVDYISRPIRSVPNPQLEIDEMKARDKRAEEEWERVHNVRTKKPKTPEPESESDKSFFWIVGFSVAAVIAIVHHLVS